MSHARTKGLAYERRLLKAFLNQGLNVRRLPERNRRDQGDLKLYTANGFAIIIEAKARKALNLHKTIDEANNKAKNDPDSNSFAVVAWKKPYQTETVTMRLTDFVQMVRWAR